MFRCERCGSQFSAVYAAAVEHCPRCQIRDRIAVPLSLVAVPAGRSKPNSLHADPGQVAIETKEGDPLRTSPS
jgi:predicted  nucleic acid-binding Zn-ribbon protein